MATKLEEFLEVWGDISRFIANDFRPTIDFKDDYCPYGTDIPVRAAIFNGRYAAFESFREWNEGADKVVRLEQIVPDPHMVKRYEEKGLNPSTICEAMEGYYLSTAFFLVESILDDYQSRLRTQGKK